jgi:histone demethylase JARID1
MLRQFVTKANEWAEEANSLISKRSINTNRRKSEKGKKIPAVEAVQQPRQPEAVTKMIEEGKRLAFDSHEMEQLQTKEAAIRAWRAEARGLMALPQISIEKCESVIENGQALNVDLPEVQQFITYVNQLKWLDRARPAYLVPTPLQEIITMWEDGKACGVPVEALEMHRLKQRREQGEAWEEAVAHVLAQEKTSIDALNKFAAQASNLCVKPETLAKIKEIISKTQNMQTQVSAMIARTEDPDYLRRPTAAEYKELMERLDSLTVRPAESDKLPALYTRVNEWIRRGKRLFGKANAPLDIFGLHLEYVVKRNGACLSLEDVPRDPVEPSSREATPALASSSQEMPKADIFCMCRQPESGLMLECDVCHEWYHGKCLKVAKKDVKGDNKYVCPICDWRIQIPRPSHRPKLEDMQELERDARLLPFQVSELDKLQVITATAQKFRERLQPFLAAYLVLTSAELPTLRFYLRKLEGAEVLLHAETNFFRRKIHEFHPIAPTPPPTIAESKSTKKPRLSKKKREELEAAGIDPAQHMKAQNAQLAMGSASPSRPSSPPLHSELPSRLGQSSGPVFVSGTVFETQPQYQDDGANNFASPVQSYHTSGLASNYESGSASPATNAFAKGSTFLTNNYSHTQHLPSDMQLSNNSNLFAQLNHPDLSPDMMSGVIRSGSKEFDYVDSSKYDAHHNHEDDQAAKLLAGFSRGEVDGKLSTYNDGMHDGDDAAMSEFLNP